MVNEFGDPDLEAMVGSLGLRGVQGEMKNLIFASTGPKPRIVLRDAVNNEIEIVENAEYCLVYDRPLGEAGLSWGVLVDWWTQTSGDANQDPLANGRQLYSRLRASVPAGPEETVFRTYCARYGNADGWELPALIPQVYLHYDPYTVRELSLRQRAGGEPGELARQRMDFLLLASKRRRIVLEIDGKQHYADGDIASPFRYAEMVSEDRRLRLAGYELYRFGGAEFLNESIEEQLASFFDQLLDEVLG